VRRLRKIERLKLFAGGVTSVRIPTMPAGYSDLIPATIPI